MKMKLYGDFVNEAKYNSKKDILNGYFSGDIDIDELRKYSQSLNTKIATKDELDQFLTNNFMQEIMADTHNISKRELVNKVKELLKHI